MSNKATFRALREEVGISHADLAHMMKVHVNSVKRWENPAFTQEPPADAFALLNEALEKRNWIIDTFIGRENIDFENAKEVQINYYRDQDEYDKFGRDKGNFKIANANARAVARELELEGITNIEFVYPQEHNQH